MTGLLALLSNRRATIGIYGLGYVGIPLFLRFSEAGYKVVGFDIDEAKVSKLNAGQSYLEHLDPARVGRAIKSGARATSDFAVTAEVDAIIICVPTPLNAYREPDLSYVESTVDSIQPYLRSGQVVSLESTTYPGTSEEVVLPKLTRTGLSVGDDIFLVYSPEREDPGNRNFDTQTIPKVYAGHTAACRKIGEALYSKVIDQLVPVSSLRAAELTKLLENIHRAVNIGLVNEMKIVADRMGIDIFEVIAAAATKPFGFVPYYPGPGLGGHCIPIDPFYLTWKAREYGVHTRFIELAGEVNAAMPDYVISKIVLGLNSVGKPVNSSNILVLGIAYKKNVGDVRESPALVIIKKLLELKAKVMFYDPHVPELPQTHGIPSGMTSVDLQYADLKGYDCVVIVTDHDLYDFQEIKSHSQLIVDTRGRYADPFDGLIKA